MAITKATNTSQSEINPAPPSPSMSLLTHPTQSNNHLRPPDLVEEAIRVKREHIRHSRYRRDRPVLYVGLGRFSEISTGTNTVRLGLEMECGLGCARNARGEQRWRNLRS
jgi:hypothetical protein